MSEGPGGPQGATAGGTLAMRMLSQQAMVASQMKRAANDKAIAQMLASKKSGPPAARLGDEIQHKSFLGALAGAVLGAIVTIAEGCLIMAACATGPYALVLVPVNRPGFPGECFICELRLPDHRFRWKHNKLFLLLPEEYGPAFPAIVDCYTSPPT